MRTSQVVSLICVAFLPTIALGEEGGCPAGWKFIPEASRCYKVPHIWPTTAFQAAKICQDQHEGARLGSIPSATANAAILKYVIAETDAAPNFPCHRTYDIYDVYLGLSYNPTRGNWVWSDGKVAEYTNWDDDEPNVAHCATMMFGFASRGALPKYFYGRWETGHCENYWLYPYHAVLCELDVVVASVRAFEAPN